MHRVRFLASLLAITTTLLAPLSGLINPTLAHAQPANSRYFPETRMTVSGRFLEYWNDNGGLMQQGYPITGELESHSDIDGKTYTVQYFERAVFELHPENKRPYDVLLSLLGVLSYRQKYPNGAPNQTPNNDAGSVFFPETGKRVGGSFLVYFNRYGGIPQQGFPISNEFQERSDLDGKVRTVQYFERAVFEWNPQNQPPYNVLLAQLGTFAFRAGAAPHFPAPAIPASSQGKGQYSPQVSGHYLIWGEGSMRQGSGPVYGTFDVKGFDLATNRPIAVTDAPGDQWNASISGSLVAWRSDTPACDGCPARGIYAKDVATGALYEVATQPGNGDFPAVSGRTVAWIQLDLSSGNWQVFTKDVDTNNVARVRDISSTNLELTGLKAGDGFLVWNEVVYNNDNTGKVSNLLAYDLATGKTTNVLSYTLSPKAPLLPSYGISDHKLAVNDLDGNLFIKDLLTGTRLDLPYKGSASNLLLQGNMLIFSTSPGDADIYAIDLREPDKILPLILAREIGTERYHFALAGDYLVWVNSIAAQPQLRVKLLADLIAAGGAQTIRPVVPPLSSSQPSSVQTAPFASDRYLVWHQGLLTGPRFLPYETDIFALDLQTNKPLTVTTAPGNQFGQSIEGSLIAWQNDTSTCLNTGCPEPGIVAKDLASGTTYDIATDAPGAGIHHWNAAVTGRTVAWIQNSPGATRIVATNVDTRTILQVREVLTNTPSIQDLQAGGGLLAWRETIYSTSPDAANHVTFMSYDLASGKTTQVASYDAPNNKLLPDYLLNGTRMAMSDAQGNLFVQDLVTGKRIDLPYKGDARFLSMQGDKLLIEEGTNAPATNVYGIDLSHPEKQPVPVLLAVPGIVPPYTPMYNVAIAGDWLVWNNLNDPKRELTVQKLDLQTP